MSSQTAALFHSLREPEAIALVVEVLRLGEATQAQLVERSRLPQPTVSRYLKDLQSVGLLRRRRATGPYTVSDSERTRRLLDDASGLVAAILKGRVAEEEALQRRVRRTRLDVAGKRQSSEPA